MDCVLKLTVFIFAVLLPTYATADKCLSPVVQSNVYTTTDASVSTETVVIVEFSVTCNNGIKGLNLFAEFNGKTVPTSKVDGDTNKYQVSFNSDEGRLPSGTYEVRVFDDEGYSALRKAQRSGDDSASMKSLFNISVNHKGTWKGTYLQSEFVAAMTGIAVWYFAYTARSKLQ